MKRFSALALLLCAAMLLFAGCAGAEEARFMKLVDTDVDAAELYYYTEISANAELKQSVDARLSDEADRTVDAYMSGELSSQAAYERASTLARFSGCSHRAGDALTLIEARDSAAGGDCLSAYIAAAGVTAYDSYAGVVCGENLEPAFDEFKARCEQENGEDQGGFYEYAFDYCDEVTSQLPEGDELRERIDEYRTEAGGRFEAYVLELVESIESYGEKREALESARALYDSGALSAAVDALPTELFSLDIFSEGSDMVSVVNLTSSDADNLGNSDYDSGKKVVTLYFKADCFAEWTFYLGGEYSMLEGTFFTHYEAKDETGEDCAGVLIAYADGEQIYRSDLQRGGILPEDFTVYLLGVEKLTLRVEARRETNGPLTYCVADCYLWGA